MGKTDIVQLHGFASSAKSAKARSIEQFFASDETVRYHGFEFSPTSLDFKFLTITGMINRLRQYVLDQGIDRMRIVGSSLGCLVGLHYAHRFGGVDRLLLLAPALRYRPELLSDEERLFWEKRGSIDVEHLGFGKILPLNYDFHRDGRAYMKPIEPLAKTRIVHGIRDDVIPVESSRRYATAHPGKVTLVEVDSDHRLLDVLPSVLEEARPFLVS